LIELGILSPADDGTYDPQDITTVRLALALEDSGVSLDDVSVAIGRAVIPPLGRVIPGVPIGLIGSTHAEVAQELGLDADLASRLLEALGLPDTSLDAPIREDDAELFAVAAEAIGAGLSEDTLLRTFRIFAEHLDRIAEHQRVLFRKDVQDRMLAAGMPRAEMLEASGQIRGRLLELSFRGSHLIHRRLLERNAFENSAEQMELLLEEVGVRRRPQRDPQAIVFVDLSGFTRMTEDEGDERAAERSLQLAQVVRAAGSQRGGRVVKLLGDGAMLHFPGAWQAAAASVRILDDSERAGLPAARAGIVAGPVIRRDGDYFGHTVNLAARICDAASAHDVLASAEVAELTVPAAWTPLRRVELKGIPEPVDLMRLTDPDRLGERASGPS
ncbi:MAG TPA: adenylate cyclase regulatory domain-containing protein, partial [Actinomycetota bacterium]